MLVTLVMLVTLGFETSAICGVAVTPVLCRRFVRFVRFMRFVRSTVLGLIIL